MATRREISDDIKRTYGSVINKREAADYLGMCRTKTIDFLEGVPYYATGKEKKYLAIDIARKLETCEEN